MSISKKITKWMEEKLLPVAAKVGQQRHLSAIRDGIMSTIPLTIIGGICLILSFPPIDPSRVDPGTKNIFIKLMLGWYSFATANMGAILAPYKMTMSIMAVFAAMGVSYSLAQKYKMNPLSSAVISGSTFLLVAASAQDGMIPMTYLDAKGLFTAMLIGLITVEITKLLLDRGITIKMPDSVPPAVSASFTSLIPAIVNVALFYTINLILLGAVGKPLPEAIMTALTPALSAADTALFVAVIVIIAQSLWFVGVHGAAIVGTITTPIFVSNIMENAANKVAGEAMPFIWTRPMWAFAICLGGSGATLALAVLMLRSKSAHLKAVGKVGIVPGLFNINEPVIFGSPIVLNPILAVPFIFVPVINSIIAFYTVKLGIVSKAFADAPWTTPPFLGLPLSTMDWKAFILIATLFALDLILYYPFFRTYEKTLLAQESLSEAE